MTRNGLPRSRREQQGVVLVVALVFLLLLTLMALVASGRSLLQERMAGAMRSAMQAQWSAETALRGAEWQLFQGNAVPCYDSSRTVGSTVLNFRHATGWFTTGGTSYRPMDYTSVGGVNALAYNPVYIIEYLGPDRLPGQGASQAVEVGQSGASTGMAYMYRITARATGGNPNIIRVVESTFAATVLESCGLS
ncbi:pilus assembly PilX family protein [Frateuria aurantia]|uniref:Tfp pilus assembly protein PilX n=1 Tax=Frateuria aurantia (strain ATCC 33424 / DSM 6220 / KCTC 2777 / LMG 1558 / NBRC 3245 / NCIMB 13370) TaxID=767434 RepID=H8L4L6_FRAAD|nr:pilus assembly protein [Frateuria aurantia]AFC86571.1 Tfp pilus assembly protein PilX [Frateuria aurantia DSM 6220]